MKRLLVLLLPLLFACQVASGSSPIDPSSSSQDMSSSSSSSSSSSAETEPYYRLPEGASEKSLDYIGSHPDLNSGRFRGLMPSIGEVRLPVFLIDFIDYPSSQVDLGREDMEKAFFGEAKDTAWHSLSSFYQISSRDNLKITGDVYDWYRPTLGSSTYYASSYTATRNLVNEVLSHYNSEIDFSIYDSDKDGTIDGAYFVYSRPYNSDTNFWAYCDFPSNITPLDGLGLFRYVWMGIDFFSAPSQVFDDEGLNSETLIHETGHLMGLPDFYDYYPSTGPGGGLGGADMMDYNIGDHGPFNKLLLGWIKPTLIDPSIKKYRFSLTPSSLDDQVIMIAKTTPTSVFSEYLLIDFFASGGLYERYFFSEPGIRIYHVDATVARTAPSLDYGFANDNSSTTNKLVRYMENGGYNYLEIYPTRYATDSILYHQGDDFGVTQWTTMPWYKLTNRNFNIKISVDYMDLERADITIEL